MTLNIKELLLISKYLVATLYRSPSRSDKEFLIAFEEFLENIFRF